MMYQRVLKRAFDVTTAGVITILAGPLFVAIGLLIRAGMGTPVLFRQTRPGQHGRPFTILKFRTMTNDQADDASRLTRLGKWLRSTSLDELPQLLNVLMGDMSLVGPRPLLVQYLNRYSRQQARRHEVRPGITGWAQVNGRNDLSWESKFRLDVWYVDHVSFLLDCKIIYLTVRALLTRHGITQPGQATTEEFKGRTAS
jgi:lipopolysaccharide/colanic/teichoic acid biosynthesis glycosyltransferase